MMDIMPCSFKKHFMSRGVSATLSDILWFYYIILYYCPFLWGECCWPGNGKWVLWNSGYNNLNKCIQHNGNANRLDEPACGNVLISVSCKSVCLKSLEDA